MTDNTREVEIYLSVTRSDTRWSDPDRIVEVLKGLLGDGLTGKMLRLVGTNRECIYGLVIISLRETAFDLKCEDY